MTDLSPVPVAERVTVVARRKLIQPLAPYAIYLIVTLGAIAMVFPLIWTLSTSLKIQQNITVTQVELIPHPIAWWNYLDIFKLSPLALEGRNTLIIVIGVVLGSVITSSFVAYGFARIPFPGRDGLFLLLLSTMMLPGVVTLIPQFIVFDRLDWVNTFLPLIVPQLIGHNPFFIFLMRQFFRGVPVEFSDAARIDGCSEFGIWWRIALPLSKPVLATVAVFSFQWAWNDFLYPLVYVGAKQDLWTLALGLDAFRSAQGEIESLNYMMVMAILMIVPMLAVFALGQRYFTQGFVFSGLKG